MIRQYDEMLHNNWELATDEQRARLDQMRAKTEQLKRDGSSEDEDGVEIINDVS